MTYFNLFLFFLVCCTGCLSVGFIVGSVVLRGRSLVRALISILLVLGVSTSCLFIGIVWGGVSAEARAIERASETMLAKVAPTLQKPEFDRVETRVSPSREGSLYLTGDVASEAAREDLEGEMRFLFGHGEAKRMVRPVQIRSDRPAQYPED